MDNDLHAVTASLAGLSDGELHALAKAVNGVPQIAPGLLAWIEHAAVWVSLANYLGGVGPLPRCSMQLFIC
jgi:hypothetical protein